MNAYELDAGSGIDGLTLNRARHMPDPGPGEVVVKLEAASLNYRDLLIAGGRYPLGAPANLIPLSDGAGTVAAVGAGVKRLRAGDRVASSFFLDWIGGEISSTAIQRTLGGSVHGVLAEYFTVPERAAIPIPSYLSIEEAATLPCAALTAWNAVVELGVVKPGDVVVVQGTGGVALFALQFAKLIGATVIVTSSSDEKLERAQALGADALINYRTTADWDSAVISATEARGADLIVEVGGAGTLEKSIRAVRVGGTVATIGLVAGLGAINPLPLIGRAIRLTGIYVGSQEMFYSMNRAMAAAKIRPVIDRVFEFDEAKEAYRYQESGAHFGKIVIRA